MLYRFPTNFVYWEKISDSKKIKEQLLPVVLEKKKFTHNIPAGWRCKLNTSFSKDYDFNNFLYEEDLLKKIIWDPIDRMFNQLENEIPIPKYSHINQAWYNIYETGDATQEIHNHLGNSFKIKDVEYTCLYSVIYILESQEDKNPTVFYKPAPTTGFDSMGDISYSPPDVSEGTVIIFPSHLLHYVRPSQYNRITLSYNINSSTS